MDHVDPYFCNIMESVLHLCLKLNVDKVEVS